MKWSDIRKVYEERAKSYVPGSKEEALRTIAELETALKTYFPEGYNDPVLLLDYSLGKLFYKMHGEYNGPKHHRPIPGRYYAAFLRIRSIIKKLPDLNRVNITELDADIHIFNKADLVACFGDWLKNNNWKNIDYAHASSHPKDITAETKEEKITCKAIASVWQVNHWDKLVENIPAFKASLSSSLLHLMNAMNEGKNSRAALLIPDDKATCEAIKPYLKYIRKTGIKVYAVKAQNKIKEL